MFQVDPERVMFATGAAKDGAKAAVVTEGEGEERAAATEEVKPEPEAEIDDEADDVDIDRTPREVLRNLQMQAKSILESERAKIGAKKKQDLRGFTKAVKRMLSRSSSSTVLTDSLEAQFEELKNQLRIQRQNKREGKTSLPSERVQKTIEGQDNPDDKVLAEAQLNAEDTDADADPVTPDEEDAETTYLDDADLRQLQLAFESSVDNPIDDSKSYATPWRPRDYMSAFTFIPRYLEVNQNVCAAVYLRHPVARPGLAEVPTPFGVETSGSAYVWYLRRR